MSVLGPVGRVTLTLAVALAVEPVSAGLKTTVFAPVAGRTLSCTMLPTGTPLVVNTTVTGLTVVLGSVMSALPLGLAGAATPPTLLIASVGVPAMNNGWGAENEKPGLVPAVRVNVSDSRRMRPAAPAVVP